MQNGRVLEAFPDETEVIEASRNPIALLELGQPALDYVLSHPGEFDQQWASKLVMSVARLKDAMSANTPQHTVASELFLELRGPVRRLPSFSRVETAAVGAPPEEKTEVSAQAADPAEKATVNGSSEGPTSALALGADPAEAAKWFASSAAAAALSILSFATILYGLDSPTLLPVTVFSALGGGGLAVAAGLHGIGLFKHYVDHRHVSQSATGSVMSRPILSPRDSLYAYCAGGVFLATSIALGAVISAQTEVPFMSDAAPLRLALLAATAVGVALSSYGAWPVARAIIARAEEQRRLEGPKYARSPRLLLTGLPLLTGTVFFLLNWLVF